LAEPNTVLVSTTTRRLIEGQFECQPFGSHLVKGIDTPIAVYHVQSERQGTSPLAGRATLTPLVGREQEVGLLLDRWEQVKEGRGQVVLLSGEPGIGKSRLAYTLREHVTAEGSLLFEARCSPYHQHSALYPLIDVLQRTLLLTRQDADDEKVEKLERALVLYNLQETLPLFTALLSLATPPQYPPLNVTPQKQKERTLQALLQLLIAQAERQATVSVWEDVHWADPSSLEFLTLLIEQIPTTKLLLVLTFRPEFIPSWKPRSHISQLVLNRLGKRQVEEMIEKVMAGKELPAEVVDQIRAKTDGVPLFVEELTKSVIESVESVGSVGATGRSPLHLAIPATLQEALLARLDRLSTARQVAQLGATLGREFSHELIQAVAPLSETDLHTALAKLVEAEILYQRGVGEQARYFFKHALIQDTAYQSLLKSTRQRYHQQIAQVLVERFPDTVETQPELLAHHYTEANLIEQAIPYWRQAGERASQRFSFVEAANHFTTGLTLLKTQPDTLERTQQELMLQIALGGSLTATKGPGALEVGETYTRARELCQRIGETPQLFSVLSGLRSFHLVRGEYQTARKLGEQMLRIAQSVQDTTLLLGAHFALETTCLFLGELALARGHFEQGIALHESQPKRSSAPVPGQDLEVASLCNAGYLLWLLGYPEQALNRSNEALTLTQGLAHPYDRAFALVGADTVRSFRGESQTAQELAEAGITLSTEQGLPFFLTAEFIHRGWALAQQGQTEEGIAQIHKGLTASRATGTEAYRAAYLGCLADAYRIANQPEDGLPVVAEALAVVDKTGERWWEAELYRLKGELLLAQEDKKQKSKGKNQK
jgi:predicted ATPase